MSISYFPSCKQTDPAGMVSLAEIAERTCKPSPYVIQTVENVRRLVNKGDEEAAKAEKRKLPCVTLAGIFSERNNASLIRHSGLVTIDFDHLYDTLLTEACEKLINDPHVVSLFTSPSGCGLKGAVRVEPVPTCNDEHRSAWFAIQRYFKETYGLDLDTNGKDVSRLCYLSHDPDCHYNETAEVFLTGDWQPEHPNVVQPPEEHGEHEDQEGGGDPFIYHKNDCGNAAMFCDRWQSEVAYIPERDNWLTWEGRWVRDMNGGITRRAGQLAVEMLEEVDKMPSFTEQQIKAKKLARQSAVRCGDNRAIRPMIDLSKAVLKIQMPAAKIDADPFLLGATNAVIDLKTGVVREYCREDFITQTVGVAYDPTAECPRWLQFVEEIFPDPEVSRYVWKAAGYSLTGEVKEKCFFFLHGSGDNGKSRFLSALALVMGEYAERAGKGLTAANARGDYPLREARKIVGKRLVLASETEDRERLNVGVIKDITGGDSMDAAQLYEKPITFKPVCKIWIAGNHKPTIADAGPAIWGRVRLIPFDRIFTAEEKDLDLEAKLTAEAPGILKWLVEGCLLWQQEGLIPPARVVEAVDDYRKEEDTLAEFIEECTRVSAMSFITQASLFEKYQAWATESGMRCPLTKRALAKHLRERKWVSHRGNQGVHMWMGVTIQ